MKENEDGLFPLEVAMANFLWDKWPHEVHPSIDISAEDPRTVARFLRPFLAQVWAEAIDHVEPYLHSVELKRAAHADNPYREEAL